MVGILYKNIAKNVEKYLTLPTKRFPILPLIHYRSVPGKPEPSYAGLAEMQDPPHTVRI